MVLHLPDSWLNWNLETWVFEEKGKPDYLEKNLLEQGREPTTNSTHIWHQTWELNPGHIGGSGVLSPLHHHCSPAISSFKIESVKSLKEFSSLRQYVKGFQRFYASEDVRPVTPCSFHLFYKQFSSLVEGGKIYQKKWGEKYPQHPLSSYSQTNQSNINLHVSKHINQSALEGQILTLSSAWK